MPRRTTTGTTNSNEALYAFDTARRAEHGTVCGVDEAGRGPLCGPVCVAACILDPEDPVYGINDSKKLSEKKREALFDQIVEKALAYKIVFVGPDIIDLYEEPGKLQNSGHLFQVVDIRAIDDLDAFKKRMDAAVDYIKNGPKAPGVSEIFVPGEIEANNQKKAQAEGIVYPVEVLEENRVLARRYGLDEALMI